MYSSYGYSFLLTLPFLDTLTADVDCIRRFSDFSNVIPLISKADLLSKQQILDLKQTFLRKCRDFGIRTFWFGEPSHDAENEDNQYPPFAVSSANSNDDENMDASILMSPDYVQPLAPSELDVLVQKLFDPDHLAWMRHSAAKKLLQFLDTPDMDSSKSSLHPPARISSGPPYHSNMSSSFASSTSSAAASTSQVLVSYPGGVGGAPSYALARVADHTRREEQLAQVRLAKWASDMQRSLQNERERYEALARGERAVWLTERLSECVADGSLLPISQTPGFEEYCQSINPSRYRSRKDGGSNYYDDGDKDIIYNINQNHKDQNNNNNNNIINNHTSSNSLTVQGANNRYFHYRMVSLNSQDPLGLLRWNEDLKRKGWIIVQVISSVGVVGGLALWAAKVWGFKTEGLTEWSSGWLVG